MRAALLLMQQEIIWEFILIRGFEIANILGSTDIC
jgi:hypothetical protein